MVVELDVAAKRAGQVLATVEAVRGQYVRDAAIEALDHAIGLRAPRTGQTMLDAERLAQLIELMLPRRLALAGGEQTVGELLAVVGEQPPDPDRTGLVQCLQERGGGLRGAAGLDRNEHPARSPVDRHEQVAPARLVGHLRQVLHVHVQVARLVRLERLVRRLGRSWPQRPQVAHAVAAQAAIQARARHLGVEELAHDRQQVVQRQQQRLAQLDGHSFLRGRQRRLQTVRGVRAVLHAVARLPLADRRFRHTEASRQLRHRLRARRDLRAHRWCRPGLLVQRNQHLPLSLRNSSINPRIADRAMNSGNRLGSI